MKIKDRELVYNEFMKLKFIGYKPAEYILQNLATIAQNDIEISDEDLKTYIALANDVAIRLNFIHKSYMEEFKKVVDLVLAR